MGAVRAQQGVVGYRRVTIGTTVGHAAGLGQHPGVRQGGGESIVGERWGEHELHRRCGRAAPRQVEVVVVGCQGAGPGLARGRGRTWGVLGAGHGWGGPAGACLCRVADVLEGLQPAGRADAVGDAGAPVGREGGDLPVPWAAGGGGEGEGGGVSSWHHLLLVPVL